MELGNSILYTYLWASTKGTAKNYYHSLAFGLLNDIEHKHEGGLGNLGHTHIYLMCTMTVLDLCEGLEVLHRVIHEVP